MRWPAAYLYPLQADTFLPASDCPSHQLVIWMEARSVPVYWEQILFPALPDCESAAIPGPCSGKRSDLLNTGSAGQIHTESESRKRQPQTGGEAVFVSPSSLSVSVRHRMVSVSFPDSKAWFTSSSGKLSLPQAQQGRQCPAGST